MKNKLFNALSLAVIMAMLVTSLALADTVTADGDTLVTSSNISVTSCTAKLDFSGSATINYQGGTHFASGGGTLNITYSAVSPVTVSGPATKDLPSGWDSGSDFYTFGGITTTVPAGIANGTYKVTVTVSGPKQGGGTYTIDDFFNVNVNCPTIQNQAITVTTAAPASAVYGSSFVVAATASSGLPVAITTGGSCSGSGSGSATVTMTSGTGTCTVYYNQAGNASYSPAPEVTSNTTAQKASQAALTLNATSPQTYATTQTLSTSGGSGTGAVNFSLTSGPCSLSNDQLTANSGVGSCVVGATKAADDNYNETSASATVTLQKANADCSGIVGYSGVYDAAYHGASGSCSGIGGESAGTLDLGATFKDVPGGTAHWSFTGNGNYNDQSGDVAIVISKADATCTISGYTGVYDAAYHGASGSCSGIGGESAGSLDLGATFKDVPGGTANWAFTGNGNYNNQSSGAAIVITKAMLTVTADNQTIIFGQPLPTFTFQYSGFVGGEDAGVIDVAPTCGVGSIPMYGTYPIVCSGGLDNNYDFTYKNGTLTVEAWKLYGFYKPVDMGGVLNIVKGGSTVPLKFEVFAGSTELMDVSAVKSLTYTQIACDYSAPQDEIETTATGGTVLRYDTTGGQFIYNWKTPTGAGKCYRVTMTTLDGSSLVAFFKLK